MCVGRQVGLEPLPGLAIGTALYNRKMRFCSGLQRLSISCSGFLSQRRVLLDPMPGYLCWASTGGGGAEWRPRWRIVTVVQQGFFCHAPIPIPHAQRPCPSIHTSRSIPFQSLPIHPTHSRLRHEPATTQEHGVLHSDAPFAVQRAHHHFLQPSLPSLPSPYL